MTGRGEFSSTTRASITIPAAHSRRTRRAVVLSIAVAAAAAVTLVLGVIFAGGASAATTAGGAKPMGIAEPDLIAKSAKAQATELAAMKAIGITSVRLDADWGGVQYGGPATYDWQGLDQVITSVRAAGMSVDLIIDGCPAWAAKPGTAGYASPPPASAAQFATYAAAVAARYAPQGVSMYEIWNEPNNAGFWSPKPDPAAYTADLKAAYASIKKAAPSVFVIAAGLAPEANDGTNINAITYLQDMYAHSAKGSFDALGYHPYSYPALPNTYQSWSGWSQMNATTPSIRSVMTANGDSSKQVWISEVGAPTNGPDGVGQAAQATDLTQAITNTKNTSWIGGIYMYSWQDEGTDQTNDENWFGLETASGTHKSSYNAVANAIR
jgi:hypothetical protein